MFSVKMADEEAKMPLSITNIYYDCLERIFEFLDLKDLLNVANTCKRLQIAAAAKFSDDYGKKRILIRNGRFFKEEMGIHMNRNDIFVNGPKFQLSFLRCFGTKISNLHLHFESLRATPYTTVLSQYINQYCADTLTTFTFCENHLLSIEKTFKNVETLNIWSFDVGHMFPSFGHLFPKLRHLEISKIDFETRRMAVSFPNLEHLEIQIGPSTIESATDLLNANLQLQSLDIWIINNNFNTGRLATVLNMIRGHQSISKLKVSLSFTAQVFSDDLQQLAIEHPSIVELILPCYYFTADDAIALIGQLSALKKFEFSVQGEFECDRMLNQLNGEWHFKRQLISRRLDYIIVLNRKEKN